MIEALQAQLALARCGELAGWFGLSETESGRKTLYASGTFADDPARAVQAAVRAIRKFCEQTGQALPTLEEHTLPRRLRGA